MSQFSEQILFPVQKDVWPSLVDSFSSRDTEFSIVFAEHYNKVRNLILTTEELWFNSYTASGDGTFKALSYTYTIETSISSILGVSAFAAWNDPNIDQPGNILPYEIIFTKSTDDYSKWLGSSGQNGFYKIIVQGSDTMLNNIVAGMDLFSIYPMATATIVPRTGYLAPATDTTFYLANAYAQTNDDTLLIRGAIIDANMTNDSSNGWANVSERWRTYGNDIFLKITLCGVKV